MTKNNPKIKIIKDKKGNEVIMLRVDKTTREMMKESPSSNISAKYWHPKYEKTMMILQKYKDNLKQLGDFIPKGPDYITYGQVGQREYTQDSKSGVRYITTKNIVDTGINWHLAEKYVIKDGWSDPERSRPKKKDILFIGNGVGCAGRCVWGVQDLPRSNIEQNIVILRPQKIGRAYVVVFLQTEFGLNQIFRVKDRVGPAYINFSEIRSVSIPLLPKGVQLDISKEYLKMSKFHDRAMEIKKRGDEKGYKENLEIAGKMLRDLIAKTEAVIRRKRKDVI